MPIARFEMPDGRIGRFEVPDGTTPEQAQELIQQELSAQSMPEPKAPAPASERFLTGLADPIHGGAQLLTKVLPEGVVEAGNRFNNMLAEKTGLVAPIPEGGVDQMVRERAANYQAPEGIDFARLGGNILSPVNLAIASKLPQASSLAGRMITGTLAGAGMSALSPVESGDFETVKDLQIGIGAATGGLMPIVTGAASRLISPKASTNPDLKILKAEGVRPTIGQTLGGRANVLEEKLQSVPILGDAIASARTRSLNDFNRAAINRAASQVGEKVDDIGQMGVRQAGDKISQSYDDAIAQVRTVQFDKQFGQDLKQLNQMSSGLTSELRNKFNRTLKETIARKMSPKGTMTGESFKQVDSELGQLASNFQKSSVASEKEFGDAVLQLQNLVKQQAARSNPSFAKQMAKSDAGWANLVRVEGAAKSAKNSGGIFTPGQLNMAIQTADKSVRKRAVSRGTALMQDLGNAGQNVLGSKVPNSFTTDRALIGMGALGAGAINPAIPAGLAGGALTYTPQMQRLLGYLAASRPELAQPVGRAVKQSYPYLAPVGAGLLQQE